jgi:hypothetical protein
MTLHKTLLVAVAVLALATPAMAEGPSQTGNGWVDYCHSSVGSWKWVACSW